MNTKCYLIGAAMVLCSNVYADTYTSVKCHIQLEDQSTIIRQFTFEGHDTISFVGNLTNKSVFLPDGKTKRNITGVYECVALDARFSTLTAVELEKKTGF